MHGHWSGWMDMGKAGNASTGLWPCCSYPETDVTLNPSLGGEKDVYDCKKTHKKNGFHVSIRSCEHS